MTWFSCIFKGSTTSKQQGGDSDEDFSAIGNVKIYSYNELRKATRDFTNKVGVGGFGSVYKGILKDGTSIAVKVLSQGSSQGKQEFYSELTIVSEIIHENLVRLYGCCMEDNRRILVYNYLENNSLAQTLLGSNRSNIQFNWRTRSKICIGIARGLAFLHEEVRPHIVHRDIKASNILLDKDLTPKISDFGLARLLPPNATHISTRVAGTIGYLAPEYAVRGQATRKSDIYSFGVLLLEIVSGRCNNNAKLTNEERSFLGTSSDITHGLLVLQTWVLHERGDLSQLVDIAVASDRDMDEACKFLKIGLLCTQEASKLRPTMSNVLKMLKGEMDVESENITKPGLISNFKELKIRAQNNANEINGTPSTLSLGASPLSSGDNSQATMSFTAIIDRE